MAAALLPRHEPVEEYRRVDTHPFAVVFATLAAAIGACVMAGWIFDVERLRRVLFGGAEMQFNTGLALVLGAISVLTPRLVALAAAGLGLLIGVATLVERAADVDLHVDQLLVDAGGHGAHPGRMPAAAAVCLVALGVAQLLILFRRRGAGQALATLAGLGGVLAILAHLYGVTSLQRHGPLKSVAVAGALALLVLCLGVLARVPNGAFAWIARSPDAGAQLLRLLLPFAVIGLPSLGYLCVVAERRGVMDSKSAAIALVLGSALVVTVIAWLAALRLARLDRSRLTAIDDLTRLTDDLENQVQRRASQLEKGRAQLAILEDRHRIASDLHDIVIQRLFAAGMYLDSTTAEDPRTRERIEAAVEAMDTAIKDLRKSIFELGSQGADGPQTIDSAVGQVCYEASRILGFVPLSEVMDLDGRAEPARDDILAVVRESLSNVARHAHATTVRVTLTATVRGIVLTVEDDGVGMGRPERSSGTSNIRDRARRWDGDCVWEAVVPHGTRVRWTIPDPVGNSN